MDLTFGSFHLGQKIRDQIEEVGGRHDEPAISDGPAGDPGLAGGPDSISWVINGDLASVGAAGIAARATDSASVAA